MKTKEKKTPFRAWLDRKGYTIESFARESGVHYGTIANWCRGAAPKDMTKKAMRDEYPDCPIFK